MIMEQAPLRHCMSFLRLCCWGEIRHVCLPLNQRHDIPIIVAIPGSFAVPASAVMASTTSNADTNISDLHVTPGADPPDTRIT
jgi:hypothetical protein